MVVPGSGYHMPITAKARLASLFDDGAYEELSTPETPFDPLKFRDIKRYSERLKKIGPKRARRTRSPGGSASFTGQSVTVAVQDFAFQGGTLGLAAGEAIVAGMVDGGRAAGRRFAIFTASAVRACRRACSQLMQMPRTTVAVQRLRAARLPYIVVPHKSDDGRRNGVLCNARRCAYRRTGRGHRLRGRPGHRADHSRAGPAGRVPAG